LNTRFNIDYTFKFSKERFSVIDHFLLLRHTFDVDTDIVHSLFIEHNMDNCSEHDPLFLVLNIHISQICSTRHVSGHRVNWSMATDELLFNHCCVLSDRSRAIKSPVDALLCTDLFCSNTAHRSSSNEYCNIIGRSCLNAGSNTIPSCTNNKNSGVPGWKDHIQLLKNLLFCQHILDGGRLPR
jgi:hypothetical protein